MKKKLFALSMGIMITGMLVIGCGSTTDSSSDSEVSSSSQDTSEAQDEENVVYAKVTKIEDKEITYEILKRDENAQQRGERPQGSAAPDGEIPEKPEGSAAPDGEMPEKPEGSAAPDGEMPEKPEGSAAPDGEIPEKPEGSAVPDGEIPEKPEGSEAPDGMRGFTSTGESATLTVDDSVELLLIEQSGDSSEASLSDISEGTILKLQFSDENTLTKIEIPKMKA